MGTLSVRGIKQLLPGFRHIRRLFAPPPSASGQAPTPDIKRCGAFSARRTGISSEAPQRAAVPCRAPPVRKLRRRLPPHGSGRFLHTAITVSSHSLPCVVHFSTTFCFCKAKIYILIKQTKFSRSFVQYGKFFFASAAFKRREK